MLRLKRGMELRGVNPIHRQCTVGMPGAPTASRLDRGIIFWGGGGEGELCGGWQTLALWSICFQRLHLVQGMWFFFAASTSSFVFVFICYVGINGSEFLSY